MKRAALALGAEGVWFGTRFLATVESGAHDDFIQRLLAARATDTVYSTLFDQGWAGRAASGVTKFNGPDVGKRRFSDHGKTTSRGRDRRRFPQWGQFEGTAGTDAGCDRGN